MLWNASTYATPRVLMLSDTTPYSSSGKVDVARVAFLVETCSVHSRCCSASCGEQNAIQSMNVVPATRRTKKLAIHFGAGASARVDALLARQNHNGQTVGRREVRSGAIGWLGGGALPATGNLWFFTGLPINGPDVNELADADAAARLFATWDGAFAGVFWDAQREVLVVATDCLGMQPLYVQRMGDDLTLVSATQAMDGEPDLAAWGAFLSIGHPVGERSLMAGLQRVPPASILTYEPATHRLEVQCYWRWPEASDAWRHYDFVAALEQDVRAYAALAGPGTLLLSGGFDSRLLLFLLQRAQVRADALIVAHAGEHDDEDGRLARAVANLLGTRYRVANPRRDFFRPGTTSTT